MKFTTTAVALAAVLGVSAHPSGHAHRHAHRSLEARENLFYMAKKPAIPLPKPAPVTTKEAPAPSTAHAAPTTTAAPAASKPAKAPASKPSSSIGSGKAKPFCGGQSYSKTASKRDITGNEGNSPFKRATLADISYVGNIGATGSYGCNLMMVDGSIADSYAHLTTFSNDGDESQACACFNKIGPKNHEINGFFNGNQALDFDLAPGETKYLVADDNSQGGCACSPKSMELTSWGEFAGVWLEFDFASSINGGWSGADASCLVSAKAGLDIPGMKVCGHGECSTINPGGTGVNAYLGGMEDLDGVGLNIQSKTVRLDVTVGYSG